MIVGVMPEDTIVSAGANAKNVCGCKELALYSYKVIF